MKLIFISSVGRVNYIESVMLPEGAWPRWSLFIIMVKIKHSTDNKGVLCLHAGVSAVEAVAWITVPVVWGLEKRKFS